MRKLIILMILLPALVSPVFAAQYTAPTVPDSARPYMPDEPETFSEGLLYVLRAAIEAIRPEITEAVRACGSCIAVVLLLALISSFSERSAAVCSLAGVVAVGIILLKRSNALISLGTTTVRDLNEYGKLLLPVMTASLAAQGATATSAAIYTGTAFFSTFLSTLISKCMTPMLYAYLAISVASRGGGQKWLSGFQATLNKSLSWVLKTVIYVFTGYLTITGVISGTTDAAAMKAAKLTITGAVPVVGGILSDASEAVLVGAALVKNSVGFYGLLAVIAICIGPFLKIALQYLLLKATAAACGVIGEKATTDIISDFSSAMGFQLAMVGAQCVLLLISIICFMKGVG